jgi:CheY-like chemotaxis protein
MNQNAGMQQQRRGWFGFAGTWLGRFLGGGFASSFLPTAAPSPKAVALTPIELARLRILVADDDPKMRRLASRVFAELGVAPLFASDGAETVALACGIDFDLILIDPALPVLSGLAATAQIREFELEQRRERVPVVAYTYGVLGAGESPFSPYGIDAALEKPCTAQALLACLSEWVPGARIYGERRAAGGGSGLWANRRERRSPQSRA